MPTIELQGLPAFHPAAALATYGLYALIPDALIHFKRSPNQIWHPVLESKFKTVDELVLYICDPQTWTHFTAAELANTQIFLSDYRSLASKEESIANGIATDLNLKKPDKTKKIKKGKKNEVSVSRTPFYMVDSTQWTFHSQFSKVFQLLIAQPELATRNLVQYPWQYQVGQNFGLFFESITNKVFKNQIEKDESNTIVVPAICLLAIAGWKLLPCFMSARDVITPGWNRKGPYASDLYFTYPVFTRPHTQQEAVAWLHNAALLDFPKNRSAFQKLGIPLVYEARRVRYPKGGGYLKSAKSI